MNSPRTYNQIIAIMDNNNMVCWELFEMQGFNKLLSRGTQYDDQMSMKDSKSILENTVALYSEHNPNILFSLNLKKAKTSTGNGVIPDLVFTIAERHAGTLTGLGNIMPPHQMYPQPQNMQEMIDFAVQKATLQLQMQIEKDALAREKAEFEKEKKRIEEMEETYNSDVSKYQKAFESGIGALAMNLFTNFGKKEETKEIGEVNVSLKSNEPQTETNEDLPETERDKILDSIDDTLSESDITEDELKMLQKGLPTIIAQLRKAKNENIQD